MPLAWKSHFLAGWEPYYDVLIREASDHAGAGKPHVAVVLSHMAAELLCEGAMINAIETKCSSQMREAFEDVTRGNLGALHRDDLRKVYELLTGDEIGQAQFWNAYKFSVRVRNRVIHEGFQPSPEDAERAIEVVKQLRDHLTATATAQHS